MDKKRLSAKGLSPVIATVLLIAMVMVIGLIVFMWFRGLTQEQITKFDNKNIQLVCDDVVFAAEYKLGILTMRNDGDVPIYNIKVKEVGDGSFTTSDIADLSTEWDTNYKTGLDQGRAFSDSVSFTGAKEIILIPVLIGNTEQGRKTYVCNEELHGNRIIL
jgi:flagellin-like protein